MAIRLQLQKTVLLMTCFLMGSSLAGCTFSLPDLFQPTPTSLPPTATEPTQPMASPTEVSPFTCTNKYWPVALGATWVYELHMEGHTERVGTETDKIIDVHQEEGLTHFSVFKSFEYVRYEPRTMIIDYYCDADGSIYSVREATDVRPETILFELPPSDAWIPQTTWDYGDGSTKLQFNQFIDVTVMSGNFNCGQFAWVPDGTSTACWAEHVGLVLQEGAGPMELKSFQIQ
jgi:hypothetical protein